MNDFEPKIELGEDQFGKKDQLEIIAMRRALIQRGRRIFNPVAYPPPGSPNFHDNQDENSILLTDATIQDSTGQFFKVIAVMDSDEESSTISEKIVRKLRLKPDNQPKETSDNPFMIFESKITLKMFFSNLVFKCQPTIVDYLENPVLIIGTKNMVSKKCINKY